MPDKRIHRGPNPADAKLFAAEAIAGLRSAVEDFSLLLTKGYAEKSALKLVGDRFALASRQRLAVMRNACSDEQLESRRQRCVAVRDVRNKPIAIDGYNVLITTEAAMSGAPIFRGRDQTCKDLASIHGTYRKVDETIPAVKLIGSFLQENELRDCLWLLDSPVSNSGRLRALIDDVAREQDWEWEVRLLPNPDAELMKMARIVASSDSIVLDNCGEWINLAGKIIENKLPGAWLIDLS
ncbi:MAG: DUF434 domain-containing protein [Planctomycetota bacterium]|jgi:hypothetical protein